MINQKLQDYNRLLNIGNGGIDPNVDIAPSLSKSEKKQEMQSAPSYDKFGIELPSDKRDDVTKITMLLVALVVYKVSKNKVKKHRNSLLIYKIKKYQTYKYFICVRAIQNCEGVRR